DATLAADHFAVLADPLDAGTYFHGGVQSVGRKRLSIRLAQPTLQGLAALFLPSAADRASPLARPTQQESLGKTGKSNGYKSSPGMGGPVSTRTPSRVRAT